MPEFGIPFIIDTMAGKRNQKGGINIQKKNLSCYFLLQNCLSSVEYKFHHITSIIIREATQKMFKKLHIVRAISKNPRPPFPILQQF